jgi:hypothetical protein
MAQTQLRGSQQLMDASVTLAKLVTNLALPTSYLAEGAEFVKRDGSVAFTAAPSSSVAPTNGNHLVNKTYADNLALGFAPKYARKAAIIANVALSGLPSAANADTVNITADDEVLCIAQTIQTQNGPWIVKAGAWIRPADWAAASVQKPNAFIFIQQGATYADAGLVCTTDGNVTVDTTATTWSQTSGAGSISAGNGLTKTGNTLDIGAGVGIQVNADDVAVRLNGASLNVSASGVKISDGASAGQVMISGAANAATFTTLSGDISSVNASGLVTLAAGITKTANVIYGEIPTGLINGANQVFTAVNTVVSGTIQVYYNGVRLRAGAGNDYTVSANAITLLIPAPSGTDVIMFDYIRQ